jgi:hypothetical protein
MATGDITWFNSAINNLGNKLHNLSSDVIKLGIVTNATVPAKTTAVPHWGGTGTTNFATNQVGTGGGYTGPITLASQAWTSSSNDNLFQATDVVIAQNASGFTDGYWGIIYNDTDANKRALGYVELGGPRSIVSGSLTINFQGGGTDVLKIAN